MVKLQGQCHRVKNNGTRGNVLSQGILMWNIKAPTLPVQNLLARLKVQRGGQNDRMTDKTKTVSPNLRSRGHKIFDQWKDLIFWSIWDCGKQGVWCLNFDNVQVR